MIDGLDVFDQMINDFSEYSVYRLFLLPLKK